MIIKPQKPEELISFLKSKPLILYGMGDTGQRIGKWCDEHGVDYRFSDKNTKKLANKCTQNVIIPQSIMSEHAEANIVVSSIVYNEEIIEDLLQLGVSRERIFPYSIFMPDKVTLQELEDNGLVNWERMRKGYEMISAWGWIPDNINTVADYSAGENLILRDFLPSTVKYYPIDYRDRGENTIVCDFNKGQFPDVYSELSACFALMYTEPADAFVAHICEHTAYTVIVSEITIEGFPDIGARRRSGMCNDFTEQQIVDMFTLHQYEMTDRKYDTAGNSTMTFFLFKKSGGIK